MGFCLQLRVLLWKNFTLKKRRPWVLVFEIFIPLVLFFILIGIRRKQPAAAIDPMSFRALPLPSAGVIPIMQSFCDGEKDMDENGFTSYANSTLTEFLQRLDSVAEHHNHFQPGISPNDLDEIPATYRSIIEDPIALRGKFQNVSDLKFGQLIKNQSELEKFLHDNLTFSYDDISALLNSSINVKQLYSLIFGVPKNFELLSESEEVSTKENDGSNFGIIFDVLSNEKLTKAIQFLLESTNTDGTPMNVDEIVQFFKFVLLTPRNIRELACKTSASVNVLSSPDNDSAISLENFRVNICNMSKQNLSLFIAELNDQISNDKIISIKLLPQNGLVRIWMALQKQLCGKDTVILQPDADEPQVHHEEITLDDLDLTKQQREQVGILIHVLYSNPKVLYAPNNTDANKIIFKANETFVLLDTVTQFAQKILNISTEIQDFLALEETEQNLIQLKQIQTSLRRYPYLLSLDPTFRTLAEDSTIPNKTEFVLQLQAIENAACSWIALVSNISLNVFHGFENEEELISYFRHQAYFDNITVLASVIFSMAPNGSMPNHMIYKIRQNASFTEATNQVRGRFWFPGPRNWGYQYYHFGFVWIQDILERAMISIYAERDVLEPGSFIHQFPYPCFVEDQFLFMIEHVMPLCLAISWVYLVAMLCQSIVYEKEQRLKEVMKMMGLTNGVHWVAWFITSFVQMTVTVLMLTMILKYGNVLTYSDPVLIFIVLEIFAVVNIMFSFLVSVVYSKAKLAAACAGIIYFLSYVPYMYIAVREEAAHDNIPGWLKTLASVLSTTAFGMGAKYFAFYEEMGVGVHWSNLAKSPVEDDEFNLLAVCWMMVLDIILYATLTWYIENVHPGSYGLPKPWYFPLTRTYWFGGGRADIECGSLTDWLFSRNRPLSCFKEDQACCLQGSADNNGIFEPEPSHLPLGVSIENLVKVYKGTNKVAVNRLSLNLFEGQITSFLGHNGAGKTTTMSILTGLFPPTSGYARIYGRDIRSEMDNIRKSLGMCPQHNVLFDEMTVEEHLWFYARLKGMPLKTIRQEMNKLIEDVGLPMKRHQKVECLSGGMKRKLSVGIAFVGGSRTVILDEPTAGVDPYARRAIWDLIIKYKKGKTILLSTHHMDEADILGDRIAIISNGQLKCCGSALFLKNNLGDGYHLYVVKKPVDISNQLIDLESDDEHEINSGRGQTSSFLSSCKESRVTQFIHKHMASAYLASETKHELHYILPISELKKGSFEKLFTDLELSLNALHISSYGIKNTTLEEVFLKVAEGHNLCETEMGDLNVKNEEIEENNVNEASEPLLPLTTDRSCSSPESLDSFVTNETNNEYLLKQRGKNMHRYEWEGTSMERVEGNMLLMQQFWAILVKRYLCTKRNWKGLFSQILLPAFFVSVAMSVALTAPQIEDLPPLSLSPSQYYNFTRPDGNVIPFANHQSHKKPRSWSKDASALDLEATLLMASGVGATCVQQDPYQIFELNATVRDFKLFSQYFEPSCASVFVPGFELQNFVPLAVIQHPLNCPANSNCTDPQTTTAPKQRYYPSCHCTKDKTGFVCASDGYIHPNTFMVVTSDKLVNISDDYEHDYYLHTTDMYRLRRYGALSLGHELSYVPENFGEKAPSLFRKIAVKQVAKIWFNNKGYHSMSTYINTLNNAILRANLNASVKGQPAAYGITVINHPMVDTISISIRDKILQGTDVLIAIFIIVAMSFVPASFVLFLVYERFTKAKHLQTLSGVPPLIYWFANYFWDMCNYVVPATCCVLILLIFNIPAYASKNNFPAVVSLFLMYGWSVTPVMYPASFLFKEPSTAYIFLIVINLFIGITCVVTSFLLDVFSSNQMIDGTKLAGGWIIKHGVLGNIHTIVKPMFLVFPNYCLGRGLMDIAFNEYNNFYLLKTGQYERIRSPFAWNLVSRNLVAMAVSGIVFFIITLVCELKFFRKPQRVSVPLSAMDVPEDDDVINEKIRVLRGAGRRDLLRLDNITKVYHTTKFGRHLAVDKLCLGIPEGECFGLLGVNGAGKSTTFKMLTGDTDVTDGDAYLSGYSVKRELKKVQQYIGYCPQVDALYDELTAREHLTLYSRLCGIRLSEEKKIVNWGLTKLDLLQYADKPAGTYSGGNKRKLSTAIALIGGPPVIYLDEPTTGMDPYSRRFLWNLIIDLIKEGRSIVLTSHSMEECEALSTRLAIMVNGRFRCLGSIQHLKNRFGEGYSILVRTKEHEVEPVLRFFKRTFPDAILKERHHNIIQYELKSTTISLSYVFSKMESAVEDLCIEDYSVSQNTLDNVFINFVKQQSDMNFKPAGMMSENSSENLLIDSSDDDMPILLEQSGSRLSFLNLAAD
uniref:ATP-binding cassette sub-family A member 2 n=1 Tax=Strigamia maritima TaxID=126957 RepID=T1J7T4_STRMM